MLLNMLIEPSPSVWVERQCVDWTEMAFDPTKFFLHQKMKKSGFEFSIFCWSCCDVTRILTSPNNDMLCSGTKNMFNDKKINFLLDNKKLHFFKYIHDSGKLM